MTELNLPRASLKISEPSVLSLGTESAQLYISHEKPFWPIFKFSPAHRNCGWFQFFPENHPAFLQMSAERITLQSFTLDLERDLLFCNWSWGRPSANSHRPQTSRPCLGVLWEWGGPHFVWRGRQSHHSFAQNSSYKAPPKCSRKAEGVSFVPRAGKAKCQEAHSLLKPPFL